jgi:Holliday junction resolvase RusA-like endonuclease
VTVFEFVVAGPPAGKGRPRFVRATGRTFTPSRTERAEANVRLAWIEAGKPRLDDGAIDLRVEAVLERPQAHYRVDGTLGARGERSPWPVRKPDLDNVVKLVCDALNGAAYRDDAQIVAVRAVRRWANAGEAAHLRVRVEQVEGLALAA